LKIRTAREVRRHGCAGTDDRADHLRLGPAVLDALGALGADAGDLAQALGILLDGVEHRLGEGLDQLVGVDRANALDHARGEMLLDVLQRSRRGGAEERGLELQAVGAVVDPGAAGLDELAGADRGGGTDDGDQLALAADLDPEHAEAVLGAGVGDPLDQPGQGLALGACRDGAPSGVIWSHKNAAAILASAPLASGPGWTAGRPAEQARGAVSVMPSRDGLHPDAAQCSGQGSSGAACAGIGRLQPSVRRGRTPVASAGNSRGRGPPRRHQTSYRTTQHPHVA
jgi:hypothetical protein